MDDPELDPEFVTNAELLWVLRTLGGGHRAGKSYRLDPSGSRTAVKAEDYKLGFVFLCTIECVSNLNQFFELLKWLSADPSAFIIRGMMPDLGAPLQQWRYTKTFACPA